MSTTTTKKLHCDMKNTCRNKITHLGEKGYIYCSAHAGPRQVQERCRLLRPFELEILKEGRALPSYEPLSKEATLAALAKVI